MGSTRKYPYEEPKPWRQFPNGVSRAVYTCPTLVQVSWHNIFTHVSAPLVARSVPWRSAALHFSAILFLTLAKPPWMSSESTHQVTIWNTARTLVPCSTAVTIRTTCILSARRIYVSLNSINHLVFVTQTAVCLVLGKNECLYIIYTNFEASEAQNRSVRFHDIRSPTAEHCCTIYSLWFRASLIYSNNCPTRCNTKQSTYYSASSLYIFWYFADRASQYICLNINQLDALNFMMSSKLYYTASSIITPIGVMISDAV